MYINVMNLKAYYFPILLIFSILAGGFAGYFLGPNATYLKPFGDIFINLIFTAVVPLVFFSISSAVAKVGKSHLFLRLMTSMFASFIFTGIVAALYMLCVMFLFPPAQGVVIKLPAPTTLSQINISQQLVAIFTVTDFNELLSHNNMLALIFFAALVGFATAACKEQGENFAKFLHAGANIFMKVISYIMYYAPIGFFAYFAVLVAELGPRLLENYFRIAVIYYISATIYFIFAFSFYAYIGGKFSGMRKFWGNVLVPMLTSLATCSSAASIPANLQATKQMDVPEEIYETVIPLGAILHKDGSVLGAIIKIAFLFGIFQMNLFTPSMLGIAILVALLVGTVMGAIPSGGMLGEMLILSFYGLPPQTLIIIAAISIIIDPLATMLNVTGDCVCAMMVSRIVKRNRIVQSARYDS